MIDRSTNIQSALRSRQRGFLLNPFRFAPSVPTDPHWSNVVLMLPLSDSLNDVSSSPKTMTIAGTVANTSEVTLFGNPVAKFSGGASALLASSAEFVLGNGPYTLEAWMYLLSGDSGGFGSLTASGEVYYGTSFWIVGGGGAFRTRAGRSVTGSFNDTMGVGSLPIASWFHVAITHNGNTTDPNRLKMWINGALNASGDAQFPMNLEQFAVGRAYPNQAADGLDGYMSNVRVTAGVERYSATFTPPSSPFPTA